MGYFMDFHGFSWIFMDFHGFSWIFHGFSGIFRDFHGIFDDSLLDEWGFLKSWIPQSPRLQCKKSQGHPDDDWMRTGGNPHDFGNILN